ncbi:MAG: hypothetical protein HWE14_00585 [Flavobacteriia bacterium]|nr:hypothetical protein [Flavobacteriia bacterium]
MLQKVFRAFVYSNLWVGIAVASLAWLSFQRAGYLSIDYLLLCFFSTVAFYGYARWVETSETDVEPSQHIAAWTVHNRKAIFAISIAATAGATISWFELPNSTKLIFALCSVLSGLYTIPSLFNRKGVRYMAGFKIVYIAAIWTVVTTTIPMQMAGALSEDFQVLHHIERFAFILAITIPFDIRDARTDSTDLLTLPMWIGVTRARNVALTAIAFVILLQLYPGYHPNVPWLEVSAMLFTGYLIHRSDQELPDMYFSFILEGTPILLAVGTALNSFVLSSISS